MKSVIFLFCFSLFLSSCVKKRYCDCYDSTGTFVGTSTKTSRAKKFEKDCKDSSEMGFGAGTTCKIR